MTDPTADMVLYNRFNNEVEVPVDGNEHTVWGFITDYKGTVELLPIAFDKYPYPDIPVLDPCDVNADGEVNIADVNAVIGVIMGGATHDASAGRADVNSDGEVNVADINAVIAAIFGQQGCS
jgi:hypothetical protein